MLLQTIIGLTLGITIAVLAWNVKALNRSGALAAAFVGSVIFVFGGLSWAILLLFFFVSSSAFSWAFKVNKDKVEEKYSKGRRRDWGQVLANGILGVVLAVVYAFLGANGELQYISFLDAEIDLQLLTWIAYGGVVASISADTWATELGVLNRSLPRLITTWLPVERGTSGGVSVYGYLAAISASFIVACLSAWLSFVMWGNEHVVSGIILSVTLGGVAGSTFDSLLGATLQAIYYCPHCEKETERHPLHVCNTETIQIRGKLWLNNDTVNFVASLMGMLITIVVWLLFQVIM